MGQSIWAQIAAWPLEAKVIGAIIVGKSAVLFAWEVITVNRENPRNGR